MAGSSNQSTKTGEAKRLLGDINGVLPEGQKITQLPVGGRVKELIDRLRSIQDAAETGEGTRAKIRALLKRL